MRNGSFWPRLSWLLVIIGLGLVGPSLERLDRPDRVMADCSPISHTNPQGRVQP